MRTTCLGVLAVADLVALARLRLRLSSWRREGAVRLRRRQTAAGRGRGPRTTMRGAAVVRRLATVLALVPLSVSILATH